jgi:hypothetical protein
LTDCPLYQGHWTGVGMSCFVVVFFFFFGTVVGYCAGTTDEGAQPFDMMHHDVMDDE